MSRLDSQNGAKTPTPSPSSLPDPTFDSLSTSQLQNTPATASDPSPTEDAKEDIRDGTCDGNSPGEPIERVEDTEEDGLLPSWSGMDMHETDPDADFLLCHEVCSPDWDIDISIEAEDAASVVSETDQVGELAEFGRMGLDAVDDYIQESLNLVVIFLIVEERPIVLLGSHQESQGFISVLQVIAICLEITVPSSPML